MTNIEHKVIEPKLGLLQLVKQLGSVSQKCKAVGRI
jgi:molybdenum-dependent DNA-binding transcriptional regulator ModE